MATPKKTVVVVGLGYAGSKIARALDPVAHVVAVDRHAHLFHTFSGPKAITDVAFNERLRGLNYSKLLTHGEVVLGDVTEVNDSHVRLASGREIAYDYVVIASGSFYRGIIKSSTQTPLKTLDMFDAYREAMAKATNILVVGAGLAGVEYAGFAASAFPTAHVTLVHSGDAVLSNVPHIMAKVQADVQAKLAQLGVELVFNERVEVPADDDLTVPKARTLKGTKRTFASDVQLFLVGTAGPNTQLLPAAWAPTLASAAGLKVNSFLQLEGHPRIFAAGDVADTGAAKTAVNAMAQADLVIKSVTQLLANPDAKLTAAYKAAHITFLASLDSTHGTVQGVPFDQWSLTGWLGNLLAKVKAGDFFIGRIAGVLNAVV